MRLLSLVLALAAGMAQAQSAADFDGDWALGNPDTCTRDTQSPDLALSIREGVMAGYGAACGMYDAADIEGTGAIAFEMECGAEGEHWTSRAIFMVDREGRLAYFWDGTITVLDRCRAFVDAAPPAPLPLSK